LQSRLEMPSLRLHHKHEMGVQEKIPNLEKDHSDELMMKVL